MLSGYLISTADGRGLEVFDWFSVPATLSGLDRQEDIAGEVHLYLAWTVIVLAALHALAALKHHFIDRDPTLMRMLGGAG
jgi:cytochrome b561